MKHHRDNVTIKMIRTAAEAEEADREFWKKVSPEDRLLLTWQLSEEQYAIKGAIADESRLSRHVTRVIRR